MSSASQPRIALGQRDPAVHERLVNLPVQIVGPGEAADLAVLSHAEDRMSVDAAKVLDATGCHSADTEWTLGFPALAPTQPDAIARASRVSVPAAPVAGALALLRPLSQAGALPGGALTIHVSDEEPGPGAAEAVMRHGRLAQPPRFEARAGGSQAVVVRIATGGGQVPPSEVRRAGDILAAHYEHAPHMRVLTPGTSQDPETAADTDLDTMTLRVEPGTGQDGGLALTASLGRDRTTAIIQAVTLMLGLETASEAPMLEQSDDY